MATLTVQTVGLTGTAITTQAASVGGDDFANDGKTFFQCTNGGGSPITVTMVAKTACNQGTLHDGTGTVAAGATKIFGVFDRQRFNDSITGRVSVTYTAVTTVTVAAYKY
jgi:hypothetical protein